jgi:hypothetical protein
MALQDLERGNGFALIDPHGDLVAHGILHRAARVHRPAKQRSGVAVRGAVATVSDAGDRLRQQRESSHSALEFGSAYSCPRGDDCVAGHIGLELRKVAAIILLKGRADFRGFWRILPTRDYSLLSCGGEETQLGLCCATVYHCGAGGDACRLARRPAGARSASNQCGPASDDIR